MPNARKRKLQKFMTKGFKRMAAVFILPDELLFERQRKQHQEEGKQVPEEAMADMRGRHCTLQLPADDADGHWDITSLLPTHPMACVQCITVLSMLNLSISS